MDLILKKYDIISTDIDGGHKYLISTSPVNSAADLEVYFESAFEEKKLFTNAEISLSGELLTKSSEKHYLMNTIIRSVKIISDIPLDQLTIKDRLNATGLIHEFSKCFRKDKFRAMEILKAVGVSESYAEEILLRNSYILPFV